MVCSCFRLSSRVCDGEFISCVLFRYSVLSVQMFSPFRSDVHSVLFRCSVLSVQMFSPSRSDVHSVLFRCSVRSVQMFSPCRSDVQSVLFRCSVRSIEVSSLPRHVTSRPTAATSVKLLLTDRLAVDHFPMLSASSRHKHWRWPCSSVTSLSYLHTHRSVWFI